MTRTADLRLRLSKSNSLLLPKTAVSTRMAMLSTPGATLAGIRLVQVAPPPLRLVRSNARPSDYGFFDIAFAAQDTERIHDQLVRTGHSCKQVVEYGVAGTPAFSVRESLCHGLDGVNIVFLQRVPPEPALREISGVLSSVRTEEELQRSLIFYRSVFGLEVRSDQIYDADAVGHIVDLLPGFKLHIVVLQAPAGGWGGRVLLFEFLGPSARRVKGQNLVSREQPEYAGLFLWTFEVRELDSAVQRALAAGATILRRAGKQSFAPYNGRRAVTIQSPDGARIELIEREQPRS